VSGDIYLECFSRDNLEAEELDLLNTLIDAFVQSIANETFIMARLVSVDVITPPSGYENKYSGRHLVVEDLVFGAFRILKGMLSHFHAYVAHLDRYRASYRNEGVDLLLTSAPYQSRISKLPFKLNFSLPLGTAPPALIRVKFFKSPLPDERERLIKAFEVWNELLKGGFPPDGAPPGESGVGATDTGFLSGCLLEHSIENYIAHSRCFDPLLNMLCAWSKLFPIQEVEIE
jgi:hypothetical protein